MNKLMWQQVRAGFSEGLVQQCAFGHAVITRLMMLQSKMRYIVTERVEEVIMLIMMPTEELVRFNHQLRVVGNLSRAYLECHFAITNHVDLKRGRGAAGQLDAAEVRTRNNRRIHERRQRDWFESDRHAALSNRQRSAVFPVRWQTQRSDIGQVVRSVTLRVKQYLVPTKNSQISGGRCRGRKTLCAGRKQKIKRHFQCGLSGGHIEVEGVHIHIVAAPGDSLTRYSHLQSGKIRDWSHWPMLTGNPLRVIQG